MRKSGWLVAAAGLGSLVLLLTACGGSSASSSAGNPGSTSNAGGQPSSQPSLPAPGTTVMIVERSRLGWVLAEGNEIVVYTYAGDTKGGKPTCTGACAALWPPLTGVPQVGPAASLPAPLGTVTMANGGKQITYNGYPLYTFKGAGALSTKGEGLDGKWHVIKLSKKNVTWGT
jgi:predicted lipoprotein with Yx(FWY)xxD motif